jgi:hypothetical protein
MALKSISELGFLTDENGHPVTELQIRKFMLQAKQL